MKRFLYLVFMFNITMIFLISSLQAQSFQDLEQKDFLSDEDMNKFLIEKKDNESDDTTNGSNHSFSSLEVSMKQKKESISFNHESMKINLKYIENK